MLLYQVTFFQVQTWLLSGCLGTFSGKLYRLTSLSHINFNLDFQWTISLPNLVCIMELAVCRQLFVKSGASHHLPLILITTSSSRKGASVNKEDCLLTMPPVFKSALSSLLFLFCRSFKISL